MKAVISTGGKQYIVAKGDELSVELLSDEKTVSFEPLMLIDDSKVTIGQPTVKGAAVKAKILENIRADKVIAIRYKKKNRVHKRRGHRQNLTRIQISDISKK
jgi:large subunit ribosomal protein L21